MTRFVGESLTTFACVLSLAVAASDPAGSYAVSNTQSLFCRYGNQYYAVNQSWSESCAVYTCTLGGIVGSVGNSSNSCPGSNVSSVDSAGSVDAQGCKPVIVSSTTGCCMTRQCVSLPDNVNATYSRCPEGWTELLVPERRESAICVQYFADRVTYTDAARQCRQRLSSLLNAGISDVIRPWLGSVPELSNISNYFWTGLHLENNVFYWDDVSPIADEYNSNCNLSDYRVVYGWKCGHPQVNLGMCAKAQFNRSSNRLDLTSSNCNTWLPYVCSMPVTLSYEQYGRLWEDSACDNGWLYSQYTKNCYKYFDSTTAYNFFSAEESCQELGGNLAVPQTILHQAAILAVLQTYALTDGMSAASMVYGGAWSKGGAYYLASQPAVALSASPFRDSILTVRRRQASLSQLCAILTNPYLVVSAATIAGPWSFGPCTMTLPFVCQKAAANRTGLALSVVYTSGNLQCIGRPNMDDSQTFWTTNNVYTTKPSVETGGPSAFKCGIIDDISGDRVWSPVTLVTNVPYRLGVPIRIGLTVMRTSPPLLAYYPQDLAFSRTGIVIYMNIVLGNLAESSFRSSYRLAGLAVNAYRLQSENATRVFVGGYAIRNVMAEQSDWPTPLTSFSNGSSSSLTLSAEIEEFLQSVVSANIRLYPQIIAQAIVVQTLLTCEEITVSMGTYGYVQIPSTPVDTWFNVSLCTTTQLPLLSMYCMANYVEGASWQFTTTVSDCIEAESICTPTLRLLSLVTQTEFNMLDIANEAASAIRLAAVNTQLVVADIVYTSEVISNSLNVIRGNPANADILKMAVIFPGIINDVMTASTNVIASAQAISMSSTVLTEGLEEILLTSARLLGKLSRIGAIYEHLATEVTTDPAVIGLRLLTTNLFNNDTVELVRTDSPPPANGSVLSLTLSPQFSGLPMAFIIFNSNKLFHGKSGLQRALSRVISGQVANASYSSSLASASLVKFNYVGAQLAANDTTACGFWDFASQDWSSDGCVKISMTSQTVSCSCNHLTNFAVLTSAQPPRPDQTVSQAILTVVSIIGLTVSVVALAIVITSFLAFRKLRKTVSQKVLFSLSLSLLGLDLVFLIGIDRTENEGACVAVAALLHYFLLASFAWMLVEAVLQYLRFVKVLGAYIPRFMLKASLPAWGFPAAVVAVICARDYRLYKGSDLACWAKPDVVYYGVLLPIALILVVNFSIFGVIIHSLIRSKNSTLRSNQSESQLVRLHLKAAIAIVSITGLTWIFAFFTISDVTGVFQYLFCIFNSFQGLAIFVVHWIREQTVQAELQRALCPKIRSMKHVVNHSTAHDTELEHSKGLSGSMHDLLGNTASKADTKS